MDLGSTSAGASFSKTIYLFTQRWSQEYCVLWKQLGGSRCDQLDKVNKPMHDFLLNCCFAKLQRAFEAKA